MRKKKVIARFLTLVLLLFIFAPINAVKADITLGNMMEVYDKGINAAEAISDLNNGDVDGCLEILATEGMNAVGEMTLGGLFAVGDAAVTATSYIVNTSLDYSVGNRFSEYYALRMKPINDATIEFTPQGIKNWKDNGRNVFYEYWNNLMYDGAIRVKFIKEIREKKLEKFGFGDWVSVKINPFSEKAAEYDRLSKESIDDNAIAEYVFNNWEDYILSKEMNILIKQFRENERNKFMNSYIELSGFLNLKEKPDYSSSKKILLCVGKSHLVLDSKDISDQSTPFKLQSSIKSILNMKTEDKIYIIFQEDSGKKNILKEFTIKDFLKMSTKSQDYQQYFKYIVGDIDYTETKEKDKFFNLNLLGHLPTGESVKLDVYNIKRLFYSLPKYEANKEVEGLEKSKAMLEYTDKSSGEDKTYSAIAEIDLTGGASNITFNETPLLISSSNISDFQNALLIEESYVKNGTITPDQFEERSNKLLTGVNEKDKDAAVNYKKERSEDLSNYAKERLATIKTKDEDYKSKLSELKNKFYNDYWTIKNTHMNYLYEWDFRSGYLKSIKKYNEILQNADEQKSQCEEAAINLKSNLQNYKSLLEEYKTFIDNEMTQGALLALNYEGASDRTLIGNYSYFEDAKILENKPEELDIDTLTQRFEAARGNYIQNLDNLKKQAEAVKAKIVELNAKAKEFDTTNYAEVDAYNAYVQGNPQANEGLGLFLDAFGSYYRCINNGYDPGPWTDARVKSMGKGFKALNVINRFMGGQVYDEDYLEKNSSNFALIVPLMEGYNKYISRFRTNPYSNELDLLTNSNYSTEIDALLCMEGKDDVIPDIDTVVKKYAKESYGLRNYSYNSDYSMYDSGYIVPGLLNELGDTYYTSSIPQYVSIKNPKEVTDKVIKKEIIGVESNKQFTITFLGEVSKSSVYYDGITVTNSKGEKHPIKLQVEGKRVIIIPVVKYTSGEKYIINIGNYVQSETGKFLKRPVEMNFVVK